MELDRTYTDIDEANKQVQLLINEKNQIIEHFIDRKCMNCKHVGNYYPINISTSCLKGVESMESDLGKNEASFCCNKWEKKDV